MAMVDERRLARTKKRQRCQDSLKLVVRTKLARNRKPAAVVSTCVLCCAPLWYFHDRLNLFVHHALLRRIVHGSRGFLTLRAFHDGRVEDVLRTVLFPRPSTLRTKILYVCMSSPTTRAIDKSKASQRSQVREARPAFKQSLHMVGKSDLAP
eukprot:296011-Amphidinium_carterae.1